ncbi:sensor histidine kinase [Nonomuraea sp. NPDC000554]|uniref:sensor histidine kinase n=1 Tax=Nonomuraea sp. NPDC000554 TaxID=3154259 RepID=UPI00332DCF14
MIRRIPKDAMLVAGVIAITLGGTVLISSESPPGPLPLWLGFVLLAVTSLPLLVRQTRPVATVVAVVTGALLYQALDFPGGASTIPPAIALFTALTVGYRVLAVSATLVWVAGTLALGWVGTRPPGVQGTIWFVTSLVAIIILGEMSRHRREQLIAERERVTQAEHAREEEAKRRVTEERLRIARELHDLLAHSISVINLQAGVSEHLIDRDPEQARRALGDIRRVSKEVLVELRGALGVLRDAGEGEEPLAPTPGMDRLPELVRRAKTGGIEVVLDLPEDGQELPKSVDLAVYRIVQEALTNIIKHARAARAEVSIRREAGDLLIEVRDDGVGWAEGASEEGNGLVGMRERAMSLNGSFAAGLAPEGGFRVEARLPVRGLAA